MFRWFARDRSPWASRPEPSKANYGLLWSRVTVQHHLPKKALLKEEVPARSLRTQQRAKDQKIRNETFLTVPLPAGRTSLTIHLLWPQCQCSTHERQRRRADQKGQGFSELTYEACSAVYRRVFECSLERR